MPAFSVPKLSFQHKFLNQSIVLLLVFFVPWTNLGYSRFDLYSKEITIACFFLALVIRCLMTEKPFVMDRPAKYYLVFIMISFFYYFFYAAKSSASVDLSFLTHVLISTTLNFILYLTLLNVAIREIELKHLVNLLLLCFLVIAIYFIGYALVIHELSDLLGAPFFSVELRLREAGLQLGYFGAMNGRSWFLVIFASFLVGVFLSMGKYVSAGLIIGISGAASYYMLSRGAMLAGLILLMLYVVKCVRSAPAGVSSGLVFVGAVGLILFFFGFDFWSFDLLNEKSGLSSRDQLIYESLDIIVGNYFVGNGFHSSVFDRELFYSQGYVALSKNGAQNTWISILLELGLFGFIAYGLFWLSLWKSVSVAARQFGGVMERHFLAGTLMMLPFVFMSFFFVHFFEKTFMGGPPVIMFLCGVSGALVQKYKKCENL